MNGLVVRGIRKSFGDVAVLGGVDLDVARGDVLAALGPSGGGKTTLLRIIAGFLPPDGGDVTFGSTDFVKNGHGIPPQRRKVGYVPQEGALFPHLDVGRNIVFGLGRRERRGFDVAEMMRLVDLAPSLADRHPHELSGGQQQRVALARALAKAPALVLLDEPFSSLDASLRVETGEAVIHALRQTGATAVLVTHDQGEALGLADHVAVVRDGTVVQTSSPVDLYRSPVDAGVASFVGDVVRLPINVIDAVATSALGEVAVPIGTPDGRATMLIRPEDVHLGPVDSGIPATVEDVRFFGHDALVRLRATHGLRLVARVTSSGIPVAGTIVGVTLDGQPMVFPEASR